MNGPWEVVGDPIGGYRVRHKHMGTHSTATPSHSLKLAVEERERLNAIAEKSAAELGPARDE
jgi:hypothetical protein